VSRDLIEHVIKERHAGRDLGAARFTATTIVVSLVTRSTRARRPVAAEAVGFLSFIG
jgi:hypothetical protein